MCLEQILTVIAALITAIATGYIAHFTRNNNKIMLKIQHENDKLQNENKTLIKHLIASNIVNPSTRGASNDDMFTKYMDQYKKIDSFIKETSHQQT